MSFVESVIVYVKNSRTRGWWLESNRGQRTGADDNCEITTRLERRIHCPILDNDSDGWIRCGGGNLPVPGETRGLWRTSYCKSNEPVGV